MYPTYHETVDEFENELSTTCNIANFNSDLTVDPNINCNISENNIITAINNHMPIKTVKYHKHKHKKSKWITYGIMISIKYRDRLYADL